MYNFIKTADDGVTKYLTDAESEHRSSTKRRLKPLDVMSSEMKALSLNPADKQDFERYLSLEDNHEEAKVTGKLADKLKLKYSQDLFVKMTNGRYADGKSVLRKSEKKQLGYSGALAMSKSISMLYAVSDSATQKRIREAINKADSQITEEMQRRLRPSNRKAKYQQIDPSKTKAVFFEFWHYEARTVAANGSRLEPHLHKHKQLMNFAEFTLENGQTKMMGIDASDLLKATKELTAKFNTLLATELNMIGIQTEACSEPGLEHSLRVKGISREMEINLSSRHKEIEGLTAKYADEDKFFSSTKQLEEELSRKSRNEKKITSADEIHVLIKNNTAAVINSQALEAAQQQETTFSASPEESLSRLESHPDFDLKGEMSEPNIKAQITNALRFTKSYGSLEELDNDVNTHLARLEEEMKLVRKDSGSYTTLKVIENEVEAIQNAAELSKKYTAYKTHHPDEFRTIVDRYCTSMKQKTGFDFNEGQIKAMELVAQRRGITYIEGDAGTGKTTSVIKFANDMYSNKGKVIGLATQTKTASSLSEAGISKNYSIAEFLARVTDAETGQFKKQALIDNERSAIIIDEAGMVGAEHYRKLTDFCLKTDSRLVLVGDVKQLASVQHGDTLRAIERKLDHSFKARLWQNMRQKNKVAQDVAEAFRDGKTKEATELLGKNGLLQTSDKKADLYKTIANDYINDQSNSKLVLAYNNADCDAINDEIRTRLIEAGQISKEAAKTQVLVNVTRKSGNGAATEAGRFFTEGDRIVFTENIKISKTEKLKNSEVATVKRIDKKGQSVFLTVDIAGKEVTFNATEHRTFNHAYAVTTYKSQGQTVENAYVFGTGTMSSNSAYVNFSRHKEKVKLYIQSDDLENFKESAKKAQIKVSAAEDKLALAALEKRKDIEAQKRSKMTSVMNKMKKPLSSYSEPKKNYSEILEEEKQKSQKKLADLAAVRKLEFEKFKASPKASEFAAKHPEIPITIDNLEAIKNKMEEDKKYLIVEQEKQKGRSSLMMKLTPQPPGMRPPTQNTPPMTIK
ncbi:AAA family ATPase [Acidovorax sp. JHL-3]|uniref:AAA family ATPase n=1 Tax=Acidovorax sp. JHL-3 TaxID=1276755 RepID=UPI000467C4C5|nr:AAA family ATPase [Acidovorax sp. JHL-3]